MARRYSFLRFQAGVDWRDVRPALLTRLNRLGMALGEVITVTSGYRTAAQQAALARNHQNPYPVAAPGRSLHQRGLAVDAVINGRPISEVVSDRQLRRYGLSTPVQGDPVHVQLYGATNRGGGAGLSGNQQWAAEQARRWGVPVSVFLAQINQESGWDPNARSGAGAIGIAQFMPATLAGLNRRYGTHVNAMDPHGALMLAARYMGDLIHKYGNVRDALSVYNSGKPWAVGQGIGETNHYVNTILSAASSGQYGSDYGAGYATGAQDTAAAANKAQNQFAAQSAADSNAQAVDYSVGSFSPDVAATLPGIYGPGQVPVNANLGPQQTADTWRLIASQPLSSAESQMIAQRIANG